MDKESEIKYLAYIVSEIQEKISLLHISITKTRQNILNLKKDIWSNISESDSIETLRKRQEAENAVLFLEKDTFRLNVLNKLILNPYFAKINYSYDGAEYYSYIGLSSLMNKETELLICDWRSSIASLFYDSELGEAFYQTPDGLRNILLTSKRQFKISNSRMPYMVDTSMQVSDDILIEELSKNTSNKMRNIVNTIQREQNSIIRNENDNILIIQGVAGSGKTSIALHRISFLLYRNRNEFTSKDVLIISPSRIFSDYISKVLPELGEENIIETSFYNLIESELAEININFSSKDLYSKNNSESIFSYNIHLLKDFVKYKEKSIFAAQDFVFGEYFIDSEYIENLYYTKYKHMGFLSRIDYIYDIIVYKTEGDLNLELDNKKRKNIKSFVKSMYLTTDIMNIYVEYKAWSIKSLNEKTNCSEYRLKAEDIYELVLLKSLIKKTKSFANIKHLIIDEMQEYSPVQYNIIKELFDCSMTILGDIFQNTHENGGIQSLDTFNEIFYNEYKMIKLNKSYRSTFEIMNLAKHVLNNEVDIIKRHGGKPMIRALDSFEDMCNSMLSDIQISGNKYSLSSAILCKTSKQADTIFNNLKDKIEVFKITENSNELKRGVAVAEIACVKGLEFDNVYIPFADCVNYNKELDRNILYVACTRALHKLNIYSPSGNISEFLADYNN